MSYTERHADGSLTIHEACPEPVETLLTTQGRDGRWYAMARSHDQTVCWPVDAPHERTAQLDLPQLLEPAPVPPTTSPPLWKRAIASARCADGETVLCRLTAKGVVRRVNPRTDKEIGEPLHTGWEPTLNNVFGRPLPCSGQIACITEEDGASIVAACAGPSPTYDVLLWDVASGEQIGTIPRTRLGINGLGCMAGARSADGTPLLLIADRLGYVHSYNARTQQPTAPPISPLGAHIWQAVAAPRSDGRTILGLGDPVMHFYDIQTGERLGNLQPPWSTSSGGYAVAELPDKRHLLITAADNGIDRLDTSTATRCTRHADEHTTTIWDVTVAQLQDGSVIVAGAGHDLLVHRWHAETGEAYGEPLRGHPNCVKAITTDRHPEDGRPVLISGCESGYIMRWDAASGEQIGEAFRPTTAQIGGMQVLELPNRQRLLVCTDSKGLLHRLDLYAGRPIGAPIPVGGLPCLLTARIDADARPVAYVTDYEHKDMHTTRWYLDDGTQAATPDLPTATVGVFDVDGQTLAVSSPKRGAVTISPI